MNGMKEKRKVDPIASAMARKRWDKTTEAERKAHGRKLTDSRIAAKSPDKRIEA